MAEQQQEPKSKGFFDSPLGTFIAVALLVLSIYYRFIRKPAGGRRREDMVEEEPEPVVEPIIVGEITAFELEQYDGRDPSKPLMMAIKGNIYDVTKGRSFYGPPDGPYCAFAGKDASRALAKMSFKPEDVNGDLEGLTYAETDVLNDWEAKFDMKYPKVGKIVAANSTAS